MKKLHRSEFLNEINHAFPQLQNELRGELGLLHLEMHAFTRFVQSLIDARDKDTLAKAMQIADRFLQNGNAKMINALTVSFLEHLKFEDNNVYHKWAWDCMSSELKDQYHAIRQYNKELMKDH